MGDASMFEVPEDATVEIEIYDAAGAGTGIFVTVCAQDSDVATSLRRKLLDRRLGRMQRRGGKSALKAEEIEAEAMEMRVACTKAWRDMKWKGEALDCTEDNKRMIYSRVPLIRNQVDEAMGDASLFMKG
jgi:hypothetical protein